MPKIGGDHKKLHGYFQEVIDSGHFTEGKFVKRFEDMVSEFYGGHAIAVSSCGAGLFATGRVMELDQMSDGWLAPNNTFMATVAMLWEAACRHDELRPYLIDCNRTDFSMEFEDMVAAVDDYDFDMAVYTHVGGAISPDFQAIAQKLDSREIHLIEDRAHAFGIKEPILGRAAVFSLYPTKAIPVGDGGVIVTPEEELATQLRQFRNYGKYRDDAGTLMHNVDLGGFNLRMDEWTAAVAVYQMERLDEIMEKREEAAHRLMKIVPPMWEPPADKRNWYKYIVPADFGAVRQAGKVYGRTDQMNHVFKEFADQIEDVFENCAWVAENHICLPIDEDMYTGMTTGEIEAWLLGKEKST